MEKKDHKNLNLKENDTDIAQEDKKIKAPKKNIPRNMEEFNGRYRHAI